MPTLILGATVLTITLGVTLSGHGTICRSSVPAQPPPRAIFSTKSDLVVLHVVVTGSKRRLRIRLAGAGVYGSEDGQRQTIHV